MSNRGLRRLGAPLLAASVAALALASAGSAGHDWTTPYSPQGVLHLNVINDEHPDGSTTRFCNLGGNAIVGCLEGRNGNPFDGSGLLGWKTSSSGTGAGVEGRTNSNSEGATGVLGVVNGNPGPNQAGVRGIHNGPGDVGVGTWGEQKGSGWGVYGLTPSGIGVVGQSYSGLGVVGFTNAAAGIGVVGANTAGGYAGYFAGNVHVAGTLTADSKAFRIDHPLDPTNKYLQHSVVESPDMKNVYDGVVTTDRRGFATVRLPRYFQALNRSFRYQLTIVGTRGWNARVVEKIRGNHFRIETDRPNVEVSWQVTGIRKDAAANANRIEPEIAKRADERARIRALLNRKEK